MTDYPIKRGSGFGLRPNPFAKSKQSDSQESSESQESTESHVGRDFPAPVGTPFPAESSGEVIYSGPAGGFNHAVTIRSRVPLEYRDRYGHYYDTTYGHLDPQTAVKYEKGKFVNAGDIIGTIGAPHKGEGEKSTGPHAHVQITTEQLFNTQPYDPKFPGGGRVNTGSSGHLGYSTKQTYLFQDPRKFEGWADGAPFDILHFDPRYAGRQAPSYGPPGVGPGSGGVLDPGWPTDPHVTDQRGSYGTAGALAPPPRGPLYPFSSFDRAPEYPPGLRPWFGPGSGAIPDPGGQFDPNAANQRGPFGPDGHLAPPTGNRIDDPLYPFNSFDRSPGHPAGPPPAALTDWLGPGLGTLSSHSFPNSLRDPAAVSGFPSDDRFVPTLHARDLPITYVRPYAYGQMPTAAGLLPFDPAQWVSSEQGGTAGITDPPTPPAPPARRSAFDDLPLRPPPMGGGTTPVPQSYPASPFDMTSYDWLTGRWATPPAPGK